MYRQECEKQYREHEAKVVTFIVTVYLLTLSDKCHNDWERTVGHHALSQYDLTLSDQCRDSVWS